MPQERSPYLEGYRWGLSFRLARKRADYFSDIEDLSQGPDIALLSTRPQACLVPVEQKPRPAWITEQPTRPLPGPPVQGSTGDHGVGGQTGANAMPAPPRLWLPFRSRQGTDAGPFSSS